MIKSLCALTGALVSVSVASAQTVAPVSSPMLAAPVATPIAALPTTNAILRTGTEVPLKLSEELTTKGKMLRVGQRFHMEVAEAVSVGGVVVVPIGTPAIGEITDVRNKGMWGKSGHLGARILYLTVNGRQVRMSGSFDDKGVTGTGGVVAAVAFLPVAGFFTTGTSARVPMGAGVKGFIDEDVPLAIAATTQAPMAVAAPSAAMTVAAPVLVAAPAPVSAPVPTAAPVSSQPKLVPAVATTSK